MTVDKAGINPWEQRWDRVEPEGYIRSIVYDALHFDPTKDAFPPTRNPALLGALEKAEKHFPDGKERLVTGIFGELDEVAGRMGQNKTVIETLSFGERMWPSAPVWLKLNRETKDRGLWWNQQARTGLSKEGIEGLINDPASICLALGTGQWLDAGHSTIEPRFVGDSLEPARKRGIDLYQRFGLKKEDFVFFPHIKHKPGFYNETYSHLLFGQSLMQEAWMKSYRLVYELMKVNKQKVLLIPDTWFYDPYLPKVDPKFDWVGKTAEKIVVLGEAREFYPIQLEFALSQSERRRQLYSQGKYQPRVVAAFTSFGYLEKLVGQSVLK